MVDLEHNGDMHADLLSTTIDVRLNELFHLPIQFSGIEREYDNGDALLETISIAVESLANGHIALYRDALAAHAAVRGIGALHRSHFRTPAGPLHVNAVLAEGHAILDPRTMPVSLFVYLDDVPATMLPTEPEEFITCSLTYEDRQFAGIPSIDTVQTGLLRELAFLAWTEVTPGTDQLQTQRLHLLFPQDPTVLRRIALTIGYEP